MRNLLLLLLVTLPYLAVAQTTYHPGNIEGEWRATPGYVLNFDNGTAKISSLGTTKFPAKLLGGTFYDGVTHNGDNTWSATFYQWKFGDKIEDGRWQDEGTVILTMSNDKNTLTQGSRTFSRVNPIKDENTLKGTYYFFFSAHGDNPTDFYVSNLLSVNDPGSREKLDASIEEIKKKFLSEISNKHKEKKLTSKDITLHTRTMTDGEYKSTQERLSVIDYRRNLKAKVIIVSL